MSLQHHARFAFRLWRRSPTTTAIAILTLALGIGANTALFSVVDSVLLRPLPQPSSEALVYLTHPEASPPEADISLPDAEDWRAESRTLASLASIQPGWALDLVGEGAPTRLNAMVAEAQIFDVVGISPIAGRRYTADDDTPEAPAVAVISTGLWARHFGSDPEVVGRSVTLSGEPYTIIGIMPPTFDVLRIDTDLWVPPAKATPWAVGNRGTNNFEAVGRLASDTTLDEARTELLTLSERLAETHPDTNRGKLVVPISLRSVLVGDVRPALWILSAAVGLVLMIACLNLASLLLARSITRRRELDTRRALGASGRQLVGQLLAEGLVLAVAGGALGGLLALWGADLLAGTAPATLPQIDQIAVDGTTLAFSASLTLVAGLSLGLLPALVVVAGRRQGLAASGRGASMDRRGRRFLGGLVVVEVALACVLLIGGGLLLRSLDTLQGVELGFEPGGVLTADLVLPEATFSDREDQSRMFARIVEAIDASPVVEHASTVIGAPLQPNGGVGGRIAIRGRPELPSAEQPGARIRPVLGEHFAALRQPLLAGRVFTHDDDDDSQPVAIVNASMVRTHWPNGSPIGEQVRIEGWGDDHPWMTIVGVVADIKSTTLEADDADTIYMPYLQRVASWQRFGSLVVRTVGPPAGAIEAVRQAVWSVAPDLPLGNTQTLDDRFDQALAQDRFNAAALGLFATVALVLAMMGIYGVLAFVVAQRRRDLGIRRALGARRADLVRGVVRQGLGLAAAGLGLGIGTALIAGRATSALLYGVTPRDPLSFVVAALVVFGAALASCWLPAQRATTADPLIALRHD